MSKRQRTNRLLGDVTVGIMALSGLNLSWGAYQVGDHVNNFTLQNWNGASVSLYNYSDRIVLLNFWFYE